MPEIRECLVHYKHAYHILVEKLNLGKNPGDPIWTLRELWADATRAESGEGGKRLASGLTKLHAKGYVDKIDANCRAARGQKDHQTKIWPPEPGKPEKGKPMVALSTLDSLVLLGISYTPRSLILKFRKQDLQVIPLIIPQNDYHLSSNRYPG